jgi:hypothetical protein
MTRGVLGLLIVAGSVGAHAGDACGQVVFPAGSRVINATLPPYNAVPNDGLDDAPGINAALRAARPPGASALTVYLPDGVYDVSNTIAFPTSRITLQGQSEGGTILRLRDNATAFTDPSNATVAAPPIVLNTRLTQGFSANEFRVSIYDLTVDIGAGNPGVTGVKLHCNNQGGIRNVTIRSSDPAEAGAVGLDLFGSDRGPGMVRNVSIDGFDVGIGMGGTEYSMTFEDITLTNQRQFGIDNIWNILAIRNLTSVNSVPVIRNRTDTTNFFEWGMVSLVDASLNGGSPANPAIINEARLYLRNVSTTGYAAVVREDGVLVPGASIPGEYVDLRPLSIFRSTAAPVSLGLAIEDTPEVVWDDPAAPAGTPAGWWANVESFGALGTDGSTLDDAPGIQAAIDSGATTVMLPAGRYSLGSTVQLRGNVRRVMMCESFVDSIGALRTAGGALFATGAGGPAVVVVERGNSGAGSGYAFEHFQASTLVVRNITGGNVRASGAGKVFVEDVVGGPWDFGAGVRVWARQINPENDGTKIFNDGATLWALGLKTEKPGTIIASTNGARTEVLGGLVYPVNDLPIDQPMFDSRDSQTSIVIGESAYGPDAFHRVLVQDRRGSSLRRLHFNEIARRTGNGWGAAMSIYAGADGSGLPALPGPAAHWALDQASGSNVPDSVGANNATAVGGPVWTTGLIGNGLTFDGVDDFVELPNNLGTTSVGSVSFWFRTARDFTDLGMMFYATSSGNPNANGGGTDLETHINFNANDTVSWFIEGGAAPDLVLGTSTPLNDDAWHHCVATWDAATGLYDLYIDGRRAAGTKRTNLGSFPFSFRTRLGQPTSGTRRYAGLLDDVRLWGRALDHWEVLDAYFAGRGVTNYPPAVTAGPDLTAQNAGLTVTLQGQATDDGQPYPTNTTIAWSQVSGPGVATFVNPANPTTSVSFSAPGAYTLRLTISDGLETRSDDAIISVYDPLPAPWSNLDIEGFLPTGWAIATTPSEPFAFEVNSGGFQIAGFPAAGCDSFHFVSRPIGVFSGIQVFARVTSVENTSPNARAGLMFRQSLSGTCTANSFLGLTADGRIVSSTRSGSFGGTGETVLATGVTPPVYFRMERLNANQVRGFYSLDGGAWVDAGSPIVNTGQLNVFMGLAVSAYANTINTSTFDRVVVGAPGVPCDPIDFNSDGIFPDNQDIVDFITVFSGGPCPTPACNDIDFNNDGIFPDNQDVVDFVNAFAGQAC